jgi:butyrate kinase
LQLLVDAEEDKVIQASQIDIFVGRGGLIGPVKSGIYQVNEEMIAVLLEERFGSHASNLGALIVSALSDRFGKKAYIADPPSVDEFDNLARYTGLPSIKRRSLFHALNQKAAAREAAHSFGRSYEQMNMIVCHMGGGISVAAHRSGRVIDVNNALEEGSMSPERAGSLPSLSLLDLYSKSKMSVDSFRRTINGHGGLVAYTGTSDAAELEDQIISNSDYKLALDIMIYQICKEIGSMHAVLQGLTDVVVLTGGLARSEYICDSLRRQIGFIAPVSIIPGEREMRALACAGIKLLNNEAASSIYSAANLQEDYK